MTKAPKGETQTRGHRKLGDQPIAFLGLFLVSPFAMVTAWLIHVYVMGVSLDWGPIHWHVAGNLPALVVTVALVAVGAVIQGHAAWRFAEHRKPALRVALTGSVASVIFLFAIQIGTGPHRWWSFAFVMVGWYVAGLWSQTRLNVTRSDPRAESEPQEDTLTEKLGLKGWKFGVKKQVRDDDGELLRTEVAATHAPGDTVKPLQNAVPNIESLAGSPAGMSRATSTDNAGRSNLTILHQDPLKGRLPYPPPSHPGGSITDYLACGIYDDGSPVHVFLAGGDGFSPTAYVFMGMTRTGKTLAENQTLTEMITRRGVVVLYLNKAKGSQDIRPIIPGIEVAVLSDGVGEYKAALNKVKAIITYRQHQLAKFGISAWTAARCFDSPPTKMVDGRMQQMEPMPALLVHVGEADAILESAGEIALYITSKGLSVGVISGYSLQRASAESMPTGLRFNIGAGWCFGCGDEVSVGFALTDPTIAAGAHPEYWKQSMPGNFYFEGPGIPQENYPKRAKSFAGPDDEAMQEAMLARTLEWALRMAKLDRGSVLATGSDGAPQTWWELAAADTDRTRKQLLGGTATMPRNPDAPAPAKYEATAPQLHEDPEVMAYADEFAAMVAETTEVDGLELYPKDEDGLDASGVDLDQPLPAVDGELSWDDPRPPPRSRAEALLALYAALESLSLDEALRDPADPTGNTVIVTVSLIADRYPFRSRPWFAEEVSNIADGKTTPPPAKSLSRADDLGHAAGKYRLRRLPEINAE